MCRVSPRLGNDTYLAYLITIASSDDFVDLCPILPIGEFIDLGSSSNAFVACGMSDDVLLWNHVTPPRYVLIA